VKTELKYASPNKTRKEQEASCPAPAKSEEPGFLLKTLSTSADFIPYLGNTKVAFEVSEGYNPITKEELSDLDRGISTAGILLGGIGKVGGKVGKSAVDFFSNSKNTTNATEPAVDSSKNIVPGDKNTLDDFDPEKATNKQTNKKVIMVK